MSMREERRVVTAVFADLVGSTALGERLDPEELKLVVGEAVSRMVVAVEAFDGHVKDLAGDGVLAIFGAPTSHEDDAERAVRAGLRIVEEIAAFGQEIERSWGVAEVDVRVGIDTGPVVTGAIGAGSRVEYSALGDAVNTASRLQGPGGARHRARGRGDPSGGGGFVRVGTGAGAHLEGQGLAGRGLSRGGCRRRLAGTVPRTPGADDRPGSRAGAGRLPGGRGRARRLRRHPLPVGGARHRQDPDDAGAPRAGPRGAARARPFALARGPVRQLRRVDVLLAVPRPPPVLAGRGARRSRSPRHDRVAPRGRPAVRRACRRTHPVPRRAPGAVVRPRRRRQARRAVAGGRTVPDVRSRAPPDPAPRRGRAGGDGVRGSALGRRHLAAVAGTAVRRHRGPAAADRLHRTTRARPPLVAVEGRDRPDAAPPVPGDRAGVPVG